MIKHTIGEVINFTFLIELFFCILPFKNIITFSALSIYIQK